MSDIHIGIDPGRKGAIAVIEGRLILEVIQMPMEVVGYTKAKKPTPKLDHDPAGLIGVFKDLRQRYPDAGHIRVEHVWAQPADTPITAAALVANYQMCRMAALVAGFGFERVAPQTWQDRIYGSAVKRWDSKTRKLQSVVKVKERFPDTWEQVCPQGVNRRLKPDPNRAEAVLVAMYDRDYGGLV